MNLVKLQDDLRMLPMPVLQSKAQGQDPSVPPWLATAVLNERMSAQQKAGIAQGAAQGKQPSVVEQLEQKAGLMALQAQQQQQAQQQMMQQMAQAPQPAPEQVPQPQAQPEPEQMMARGGIARLPVNPQMFNYKEGGVIGFAGGGDANTALREFLRSIGTSASEFANADSSTRAKILEAFKNATMGPQAGPAVAPSAIPATTGGSYAAQPAPRGLQALRAMLKPGPAAALGAGAALSYGATKALENMSPEQRAMLENAGGGDDTAMAAAIMNAAQPAQAPQPAPAQQPAPPAPAVRQTTDTGTVPGGGQTERGLVHVIPPGHAEPSEISPELMDILRRDAIANGQDPDKINLKLATLGGRRATPELFGLANKPAPQAGLPAATPPAESSAPQAGLATLPIKQADPLEEAKRYAAAFPMSQKQSWEDRQAEKRRALQEAGLPLDLADRMKEGIGRYEAESERIRQARQKADDIYMLSARGGLGEIGQRFAERERANIAADAIRNDKANEMRMAMEAARRAEAIGDVEGYRKAIAEHDKAQNDYNKVGLTATTQISGDIRREGTELARIGAQENISRLDREMKDAHHRNPISAPTEKEKWVQAYIREGLSPTKAIERVMEVIGEGKLKARGMTPDQAADNVSKFLESMAGISYVSQMQKAAKDAGKPVPDIYSIRSELIKKEMGGQETAAPSTRMRFDAKGNPIP